ncbi:class I adenylate-forming enzyme family protein [Hydrogenophaga sp. BPS33]|uniref:class I adenylate-forming enzyme family protein n=1 Tax=Hydrogenophaga sp. BPS33 TaxID=2651974 RepID=UPI00131F8A5B|nr:AMP-binding protein [Hydrogenophaga sp. BPS33]QHE87273.1 AMP-binding protein [Hydrogenophaga sp. BPS33]
MSIPNAVPDTPAFVSFAQAIAAHAAAQPDHLAFQVDDRALSWRDFHEQVVQVARALAADGMGAGDKVALIGLSSLAYIECFFGAVAARACAVPLPASASVAALEAMVRDSGARLLFLDPDTGPAIAELAQRLASHGVVRVIPFGNAGSDGAAFAAWRAKGADSQQALPRAQADDAFNIIYSSGTTGVPKGIVHAHGMRQRQASRKGFAFSPTSRSLLSTPLYSNTTIMPMLGAVANGGACILMRKFDAGRFIAMATAHRATHTMLVPVQVQRILAHPDFAGSDLSALALSQTTGAPMDAALKREILARWPGRFLEVYGLTEGGVTCLLEMREHPDKLHTVGKAAPGTDVFLIDDAGQRLTPGESVTGEVVGRSPFMMVGYHHRPDADAQMRWFDAEGRVYHRSGDIGRFDADGFLTLLDRKKDVIISGGNNIYAADLEAVLAGHADVLEAAVIGVPSPQWGETPLALVVLQSGATLGADALRDWANSQLGKTQRLSAVELLPELPRNALGKLSKKELRAPYWHATSEIQTKTERQAAP